MRSRAGNTGHRAPEVIVQFGRFNQAVPEGGVIVDFRGQAVFEMGVLLWELAVGRHPIQGYPLRLAYTPANVCELGPDVLADLVSEGYPAEEFAGLVGQMVALEAGDRPSLVAAADNFEALFDPRLAAALSERDETVRRLEEQLAAAEARATAEVSMDVKMLMRRLHNEGSLCVLSFCSLPERISVRKW